MELLTMPMAVVDGDALMQLTHGEGDSDDTDSVDCSAEIISARDLI